MMLAKSVQSLLFGMGCGGCGGEVICNKKVCPVLSEPKFGSSLPPSSTPNKKFLDPSWFDYNEN